MEGLDMIIIDTPIARKPSRYGGYNHFDAEVTVEPTSNEEFLAATIGHPRKLHYSSRAKLHTVHMPGRDKYGPPNAAAYGVATVSLGVQALHQAFAAHVPFSLRPDTLWYFIVHQVAEYVRQNPFECARLFTSTPGSKQTITVRDDTLQYDAPSDWGRSINLIRDPLRAKVSDRTMELFLPRSFSTSTVEDETALLVAFMDAASPYYKLKVETMCGIPQIRLEGNPSDWRDLYNRTELLAREFAALGGYFADLLPVLQTIAETSEGTTPNENFWRSIYKFDNESGGPIVTGWITAFFAYIQDPKGQLLKEKFDWRHSYGFQTNAFPSHMTKVPFDWNYFGRTYQMAFVAGVTGVDYDDTFLSPRLGFAVVEV